MGLVVLTGALFSAPTLGTLRADMVYWASQQAFTAYITAQQAILTATEFVIDLNKTMKENGDMNRIYNKMVELDARLEPLLAKSETWDLRSPITLTTEPSEEVVGRSLRCMARIKLNRYCILPLPLLWPGWPVTRPDDHAG